MARYISSPLHGLLVTLLIPLFATTQTSAQLEKRSAALHQVFEDYYEDRLKLFPIEATAQGDPRYNDQLPNSGSASFIKEVNDFYKRYQYALREIDYNQLTDGDKISFDILMDMINQHLEGERFHPEYMPVNQVFSLPLSIGQLGSGKGAQPFQTVKDYENWLRRITAFTVWVDTAIANFRKGVRAGIVLPAALVVKMIPQMEDLAQPDSSKNVFYGPVNQFPERFSHDEKRRLTHAYTIAIQHELIPAYHRLASFLKNEYLPNARATSGLSSLPGGDDMYRYQVYYYTTTRKSPEEFYETGLKEVARITDEIITTKTALGFEGSMKELFESMRRDERLRPFRTNEEVLKSYDTVQKKMEPHLEKYFSLRPKSPFEVREIESFRAASAPAQYRRPSLDGSRPGIFYVPILDPKKISVTTMESLFLHEAIPGHHYQLSLQQENEALPRFRRLAVLPVFSEGWALYVESLGELLGCYRDPYQKLGALSQEMRRAVRLVVDAGIHTGKMNKDEAILYMLAHEPLSEQVATREVERYMALPGQALAYKTGELKIKALRDKYQRQFGDRFSLKDFHDALLKGGAMPLTVLEKYMDRWAEGR